MKKVVLITLGCKVCQYETEMLKEKFEELGYITSTNFDKADIYVLNTCAVTNEAEKKSRQMIAKFNKLNPNAKIFVCGCASQNNSTQFEKLPNVKYVCGTVNKQSIFDNLDKTQTNIFEFPADYENISINNSTNARAYIKIQDGCNRFCSYCLIPYLRGRSRSRDLQSILEEIKTLKEKGISEIVLTGIDVSDFKIDGKLGMLTLLQEINKLGITFRLSSLEPNLLTDEFLNEASKLENLCPSFHISMQSGSNSVLKRMNRRYTKEFFIERIQAVKNNFENVAIYTDVIVGFPGETDEEFEETLETVKICKFAHTHIFPYSRRSGTTCDKLLNIKTNKEYFLVDGNKIKDRINVLQQLDKQNYENFNKMQIGKTLELVIEEKQGDYYVGHSKNYVKVFVENDSLAPNQKVKVKITKLFEKGVLGEI